MNIRELYKDSEFSDLVRFFEGRGFSSLADLQNFNFDELHLIPRISEGLISMAKTMYCQAINQCNFSNMNQADFGHSTCGMCSETDFSKVLATPIEQLQNVISRVNTTEKAEAIKTYILEKKDLDSECSDNLISLCDDIEKLIAVKNGVHIFTEEEEQILRLISIESAFSAVNRGNVLIRHCTQEGLFTLWDLRNFDFDYTKIKGMGEDSAAICRKAYYDAVDRAFKTEDKIEKPTVEIFKELYESLKDSHKSCLLNRAQGRTLQDIAEEKKLTRERVRQLTAKSIIKLSDVSALIAENLAGESGTFYSSEIKQLFAEPELVDVLSYTLKNIESVTYFPFAEKFAMASVVPSSWEERIKDVAAEFLSDVINYYEVLEEVEIRLKEEGLDIFNASDLMDYILENGYYATGDYLIRRGAGYRKICCNIIVRYFKSGIKLDNDENNSDMLRLRDIVKREYSECALPENNRAITMRIAPKLILCGRGRYNAPENVNLNSDVFGEIVDYINGRTETALYYPEIYVAFEERLRAETSVDNSNFLHGALKYLYPDAYSYERDKLVKHGMTAVSFDDRLAQVVKRNLGPIHKAELLQAFPGIADARIAFAISRVPGLIQWDYNVINHIDNIKCTDIDTEKLDSILGQITSKSRGYCSDAKLFVEVKRQFPEFIEKNKLQSEQNLFYIAACKLGNKYRFSRPHIASSQFPNVELTNYNVAKFIMSGRLEFNYREFIEIANQLGWYDSTFFSILSTVESDFFRIDLDRYIRKNLFSIKPEHIQAIKEALTDLLAENGYHGLFNIFSYEGFPMLEYEWNEHLLQTIIENFDTGFRIIEPKIKDRRYKKGIIVVKDNSAETYEELIVAQMRRDEITAINREQFSGYLKRKGLTMSDHIPLELSDGVSLKQIDNQFVILRPVRVAVH